jgi:dihydroorotase
MNILVKNVTILDPYSPQNGNTTDITVSDGKIISIGKSSDSNSESIDATGCFISPGWCDLRANFCEPGYEQRETLASGMQAAIAGGFTAVALVPETKPAIQTKSDIEFIKTKTSGSLIDVYPYGALSQNLDGLTMAEMYDMHLSGAAGFTDGNKALASAGMMMRSLEYVKNFNSFVLSHADDISLSSNGKMNEGNVSVMLGLKSIPAIAEELMISRDIELLRYSGSRIHFSHISTAGAVRSIAKAKKEGLNVTCDVAIANLVYDDSTLMEFDTNYKVNPPLRSKEEIESLIKGINDGTIDAIVSDHYPLDDEHKVVEFDIASTGMSTIQVFYAMLLMLGDKIKVNRLIECISINPRKILGLAPASVNEGSEANFTIFNPSLNWEYNAASNLSLSKNSPLYNSTLKGKVVAVVNNGKIEKNKI